MQCVEWNPYSPLSRERRNCALHKTCCAMCMFDPSAGMQGARYLSEPQVAAESSTALCQSLAFVGELIENTGGPKFHPRPAVAAACEGAKRVTSLPRALTQSIATPRTPYATSLFAAAWGNVGVVSRDANEYAAIPLYPLRAASPRCRKLGPGGASNAERVQRELRSPHPTSTS